MSMNFYNQQSQINFKVLQITLKHTFCVIKRLEFSTLHIPPVHPGAK